MDNPFESAEFSIKRACKHVIDFKAAYKAYMDDKPCEIRTELNCDTGLIEIKVSALKAIPEGLRGSASDAIKNIRDALDQTLSAATFVVTGKRSRRTHFPFGESLDDLENSLSHRRAPQCRDIAEQLFPAIRLAKPYPHEGDPFLLKTLQAVSGPHKHSISLTLGSASPSSFQRVAFGEEGGRMFTIEFPELDLSKREIVVAAYGGFPADGGVQLSAPLRIVFDHPKLRNMAADNVMDRWGRGADQVLRTLKEAATSICSRKG